MKALASIVSVLSLAIAGSASAAPARNTLATALFRDGPRSLQGQHLGFDNRQHPDRGNGHGYGRDKDRDRGKGHSPGHGGGHCRGHHDDFCGPASP